MKSNNPLVNSEESAAQFRSFKTGSEAAFRYFFHQNIRAIFTYTRNMVRNDVIAEDITQDCFIKLDQNRDKINDVEHLKKYLYTVARNAVLSYFVDLKKQQSTERSWADFQYQWAYQYDDVEMIRDRTLGMIYDHIDQLPPKRKEVFMLSFHKRMAPGEIARELDISESTVYNHLYKAYQYFAKVIPSDLFVLLLLIGWNSLKK
jgi:RNA polymerase sigma-70 factor (ECF subfamily)